MQAYGACPDLPGEDLVHYDYFEAVGSYITVAATFATIAFAVVVLVLGIGRGADNRKAGSLGMITAASVALLASSYLYSESAGERLCGLLPAQMTITGVLTAVGALATFTALIYLPHAEDELEKFLRWVACLVLALSTTGMSFGGVAVIQAYTGTPFAEQPVVYLGAAAVAVLTVGVWWFGPVLRRKPGYLWFARSFTDSEEGKLFVGSAGVLLSVVITFASWMYFALAADTPQRMEDMVWIIAVVRLVAWFVAAIPTTVLIRQDTPEHRAEMES